MLTVMSLLSGKTTRTRMPTVEEWADHNSRKASADGIIAAVIVESLAKEWDDWVAKDLVDHDNCGSHTYGEYAPQLSNAKKNINIKFGVDKWTTGRYNEDRHCRWTSAGTTVNGIELELKAARFIAAGYEKLAKQQQALQEQAARSKAAMELNEKKWNLAEQLLGYKRVNGALVPAQAVEV